MEDMALEWEKFAVLMKLGQNQYRPHTLSSWGHLLRQSRSIEVLKGEVITIVVADPSGMASLHMLREPSRFDKTSTAVCKRAVVHVAVLIPGIHVISLSRRLARTKIRQCRRFEMMQIVAKFAKSTSSEI